MSMHKLPLSELEEEGLKAHGLSIGTPSQLSDAFRQGVAWALSQQDGNGLVPPVQDEREAFEAWYVTTRRGASVYDIERLEDGSYKFAGIRQLWDCWQARANRPAQTEQQPVGRVFTDEERFRSDGKSGPVWWFGPLPAGAMLYAAPIAQTAPHDALYAPGIAEQLERTDWTPEEALRWYAEGKHFDTVNGRTRIIDSGAIASNALKHLSLPYLEMKGDAELSELRTRRPPKK